MLSNAHVYYWAGRVVSYTLSIRCRKYYANVILNFLQGHKVISRLQ